VARQLGRVLGLEPTDADAPGVSSVSDVHGLSSARGTHQFFTSGEATAFATVGEKLLGHALQAKAVRWQGEVLRRR
jgi:hypothetical protein